MSNTDISSSSDGEYDESTENLESLGNVPDVDKVEFTKKETFYYKIINKYYKALDMAKILNMIDIIEGRSKISLRFLDWFITKYSDRHKIRFEVTKSNGNFDDKIANGFNVHISYKAQLKSYKKKYFDPFRRRKKFKFYFDKEKKVMLCTTIGQLNFFRWVFSNNIIEYITDNFATISKAMALFNKTEKARKKTVVKQDDQIQQPKLVVISAKQKNVKPAPAINKIVLSFD